MKVSKIKEIIADKPDDEEVFCVVYEKTEADEHIEQNLNEEENIEVKELTAEEWHEIVSLMDADDGIWEELSNSFNYYIEALIGKRGETNESVNTVG